MSSEPFRSGRCPVEPLIPTERSSGLEEMFFDRFFHAPQTETLGRLWSDLDRLVRPQVEGRGDLQVDVPLTREKAMRGGRVRVWIPLATTCPSCRGYGHVGAYGCWECSGEGSIVEQRPVWISFPAGISHNTVARVSLAPLGAPHTYLSVRFSVGGQRRVTIL